MAVQGPGRRRLLGRADYGVRNEAFLQGARTENGEKTIRNVLICGAGAAPSVGAHAATTNRYAICLLTMVGSAGSAAVGRKRLLY